MEAQSKPVIVARNPSVVRKQKRIEPLPSGYAVRELCNGSEGDYWYVVGKWSLLSSLIDLQNLAVHRSQLEAALVQPALDLVFREADVRPNPYVRDDSPRHVPVDRLVVTESRLRVDGMAGAQQWRSRWVLPETPTEHPPPAGSFGHGSRKSALQKIWDKLKGFT